MLAYLFLLLAVAARFMPHPWTFTPVAAALLFFGAYRSRRQMWIPVAALIASDLLLDKFVYAYPFKWDLLVSWAWYAAIVLLGVGLGKRITPLRVIGASLASSISFFLLSNFAVWAAYDMYPKTFAGLMTCYTVAVPFFRNALQGDLLFSTIMFATPVALHALNHAFSKSDHAAAA
ncbi:MAG TPA: DUF6580 family putative transport protein [Terriglobales bacterium]|nr:DUF6580 family putative transport protein [Terriglobales bacterium]